MLIITDRKLVKGDFAERIRMIDNADIDGIVLREKDWSKEECIKFVESVKTKHRLYVNNPNMRDYEYISIPYSEIYNGMGEGGIVSVHSVDEAKEAERLGAKQLITGHIFATDCKRGLAPRGLDYLKAVTSAVSIPVYAIGGIDESNAESVMRSGAYGVAVMSSAMVREDIFEYLNKIACIEKRFRNR